MTKMITNALLKRKYGNVFRRREFNILGNQIINQLRKKWKGSESQRHCLVLGNVGGTIVRTALQG